MRLIDADELKEQFAWSEVCRLSIKEIHQIINNAPTITPDKAEYYHLDNLPDAECTVKLKDNPHICSNCRYLIFKRYDERRGFCRLLRIHRNFDDACIHEEEML